MKTKFVLLVLFSSALLAACAPAPAMTSLKISEYDFTYILYK